MGGYGSTRWDYGTTHRETDPLLKLDIRIVRKMGALQPGAYATHAWTSRGEPSGTITTIMHRDRPCLTLDYRIRSRDETDWTPIREDVWIDETACHYGGTRPWFLCPGCNERRGVLFSVDGRFRCRQCHRLAYSSTREDPHERSIRRCQELQRKLGGGGYGVPIWTVPPKPDGMSWRKYLRLRAQFIRELNRQRTLFDEHFVQRFGHLLNSE
jgi:hypothetical protein